MSGGDNKKKDDKKNKKPAAKKETPKKDKKPAEAAAEPAAEPVSHSVLSSLRLNNQNIILGHNHQIIISPCGKLIKVMYSTSSCAMSSSVSYCTCVHEYLCGNCLVIEFSFL